jgi:hypothetical protein
VGRDPQDRHPGVAGVGGRRCHPLPPAPGDGGLRRPLPRRGPPYRATPDRPLRQPWVLWGRVVSFPLRRDRSVGLPLRWRGYENRGAKLKHDHRTPPAWAADAVRTPAEWRPGRESRVVADRAAVGKAMRRNRPENADGIGPVCWHAAWTDVREGPEGPTTRTRGRGCRPSGPSSPTTGTGLREPVGSRSPTERGSGCRSRGWRPAGPPWPARGGVVLARDPQGHGRDEALVSPPPHGCDGDIGVGDGPRWSADVALGDATGRMGFPDPCVWKTASVPRATPRAWFPGTLVMRWSAREGAKPPPARRHRPWSRKAVTTFADRLGCGRLARWTPARPERGDRCPANPDAEAWLREDLATAASTAVANRRSG